MSHFHRIALATLTTDGGGGDPMRAPIRRLTPDSEALTNTHLIWQAGLLRNMLYYCDRVLEVHLLISFATLPDNSTHPAIALIVGKRLRHLAVNVPY